MDIGKVRSLVGLLSELANVSGAVSDLEDFCSFTKLPKTKFTDIQQILDSLLNDLGVRDHLNPRDLEDDFISLHFDKQFLKSKGILFFIKQDTYRTWLGAIEPFKETNFFNSNIGKEIYLIIPGLEKEYFGPSLHVVSDGDRPKAEDIFSPDLFSRLPDSLRIKEQVHILSAGLTIEPQNFGLINPDSSSDVADLVKYNILALAACLAHEIKSPNVVVLRGRRKIEITLYDDQDFLKFQKELLRDLLETVRWIYEEKTETRQKLISDRLSLDISGGKTFIAGLIDYLGPALADAKDKYDFIIAERVEEYYKDWQALQLQINVQIQSYADKIRNLLGNLLKDVLAGLFLVGFSLFSGVKSLDFVVLATNKNILLLFKGLSVYLAISFLFSVIVNVLDIRESKNELIEYAKKVRSYMDAQSVVDLIETSLSKRESSFAISLGVLFFVYLLIILFCSNLGWFIEQILKIYPITNP